MFGFQTTVSRLLFRFYDPIGGAVKVNGVDVRSITQASLRNAIGVVPQNASMFNDTIRANLRYGRRDARDEEVEQAARDAQLLKFIESMNVAVITFFKKLNYFDDYWRRCN